MVRDRDGASWLGRIIVLVVVTIAFFGVYFTFFAPQLPEPFTPAVAETGDFAEVDYIGSFPDTGRVFDTSLEAVAKDNATFPKAVSFSYRQAPSVYEPLGFTIGCTSGEGCPIPGFQDITRGLRPGETTRVVLSPEDAYGPSDPARVEVRPLLEEVAVTETMNATEFLSRYAVFPQDGQVVKDLTWGWNVTVRVSGDTVTIRNSPTVGLVLTIAGAWSAEVVAIDDGANGGEGAIRVQHRLTEADVGAFVGGDRKGNFIVVAIDLAAGTYTVDYNPEVVGKPLAFEVTLVGLRKGAR